LPGNSTSRITAAPVASTSRLKFRIGPAISDWRHRCADQMLRRGALIVAAAATEAAASSIGTATPNSGIGAAAGRATQ
jgi:hypothetical protein